MKKINQVDAFTLIEVLVAMAVFSIIIGISSQHLKPIIKRQISTSQLPIELKLIQSTNIYFRNLKPSSPYLVSGFHSIPSINNGGKSVCREVHVRVKKISDPKAIIGHFECLKRLNKSFEWYVYRQ